MGLRSGRGIRSRSDSQMGVLLTIFEVGIQMPNRPRLELPQPHTGETLQIPTSLCGVRNKRTTPPQAIHHMEATLLQDKLSGYFHLFTDSSVKHSTC